MNLEQKKAELKKANPFYGAENLFALYHNERNVNTQYINDAWNSCTNKQYKELFNVINFNIGSVDRNNNVFKNVKVDSGGKALNPQWIIYLQWLLTKNVDQFIEFLTYKPSLKCCLFFEFVSPREFLYFQIKTNPKTKNILGTWGLLKAIINHKNTKVYETLLNTVEYYIKSGTEFQKWQMAKMIHTPKYSNRQKRDKDKNIVEGGRPLQAATKDKFDVYETLCDDISKRMDWYVIDYGNNKRYTGLVEWRKDYIDDTEFVLFSNKKILEFDRQQFHKWLNDLPASARYRVKRRLYNPENTDKWVSKYGNLKEWFDTWENYKKEVQSKRRILEEKEKTVGLSDAEKVELSKATKESKVTTGAKTIGDYVLEFIQGSADDITVDAILNKHTSEVPILCMTDCSGSMGIMDSNRVRPVDMARLITTLSMIKNPSNHYNVVFTFGSNAHCYTDSSIGTQQSNMFMQGKKVEVERIIDRTKTFMDNYKNVSKFVTANEGSTNISGLAAKIKEWVDDSTSVERIVKLEQLLEYKVILLISDAEFNNKYGVAASLADFRMKMKQWFNWDYVIAIWDVSIDNRNKSNYFENMENVIHIAGSDPTTLDQVFGKITDVTIIDTYTPLNSLYLNTKYSLIKEYTL